MKKFFQNIWNGWKRIALKIGRINTVILLTVFYFLILAPTGLIFKLFGWDPLNSSKKSGLSKSNWKEIRDQKPDINSLFRQS